MCDAQAFAKGWGALGASGVSLTIQAQTFLFGPETSCVTAPIMPQSMAVLFSDMSPYKIIGLWGARQGNAGHAAECRLRTTPRPAPRLAHANGAFISVCAHTTGAAPPGRRRRMCVPLRCIRTQVRTTPAKTKGGRPGFCCLMLS